MSIAKSAAQIIHFVMQNTLIFKTLRTNNSFIEHITS